jgi:hypothetical protein
MPRHNLRHENGRFKKEQDPEELEREEFLQLALERFKLAEAAEARWRRDALEDFEFYIGEQWPQDIKTQRDRDRRPCLTINRLKPSKRIITNEYRQQRPAIQVNPVGDGATVETAEIEQGIVRHIEVGSDAEVHYDTTFDHMVIGGLGWLELSTAYQAGRTLDQELQIRAARNPFMHYADPGATEIDYSDAGWHFKIHDYSREEFEEEFPDAIAASLDDFSSVGDNAADWLQKDAVRVAEYWHLEYEDAKLYELEDGSIVETVPEGLSSRRERKYKKPVVWKAKITAVDILEDVKTVFDSIPNVPMIAEDLDVNGRRYIAGMVRDAKDPQRQFNYWETAITEAIALAPKSPFKAYKEVIEGNEAKWQAANRGSAEGVLTGKAVVKEGQLLPLPQRESPDVPIQGLAAMRQSAAANLEAVTGLNDATLGRMRPDESGKAVLARQKQGDISNLNYSDNAARALRRVGRLLLAAIPKVYDVPQIMRIIKPDGTADHVITHHGDDQIEYAQQLQAQNPAIKNVFDLSVGRYDVTISVGPSYQTKRQEAVASIMALIQAAPNVISIVGDLLVGNMDWNNAPEIAKRLKKMLPPQLQDENGAGSPEQLLQQTQQQLVALQQVHQQVMGAFQQAMQLIQTKKIEQAGKFSIEKLKQDAATAMAYFDRVTKLEVANITAKSQDAAARAAADADMRKALHDSAHELAMVTVDHQNNLELGEQAGDQAAAAAAAAGVNSGAGANGAADAQAQV